MSASESEDLDFDDEQEDQVRKSRMWQKYINDFFLTKIYSKVFFSRVVEWLPGVVVPVERTNYY